MQIILMEKVINLGALGDVVKVKDGYARNFLIPQGKAKRATEKNLAEFEARRHDFEKQHADVLVIDLDNFFGGEAAEFLAAEQTAIGVACVFLVLVELLTTG